MPSLPSIRVAARSLLRSRGVALTAVVTLGLAIGAATVVWSIVYGVLLRPLPFRDPERLVYVTSELPKSGYQRAPLSGPEIADLRERSRSLAAVAGLWPTSGALVENGEPRPLAVGLATSNLFAVLGVEPAAGRLFVPEDEGTGAPARVVISHALWRERFGGAPAVVGRTLRIDGGWGFPGGSFEVIGVAPSSLLMTLPSDAGVPPRVDAWIALQGDLNQAPRGMYYLRTLARLREGIDPRAADEEVRAIGRRIESEHNDYAATGRGLRAGGLHAEAVAGVRGVTLVLLVAVSFVVLVACANVGGLLLARLAHRRRELAIRSALGASRRHLAVGLLVECLLLAGAAGAIGVAVARASLGAVLALAPAEVSRLPAPDLSLPVLAATAAATLLTALLFGAAPFLLAPRLVAVDELRGAGRRQGERSSTRRTGALVAAEIALGVVLLHGAVLLGRSFVELLRFDPGFDPRGVLTFRLTLPPERYAGLDELVNLGRELERRLAGLPGVVAAGAINQLPLDDVPNWSTSYATRDTPGGPGETHEADARLVTPGYLPAIGARLLAGRLFNDADDASGRTVAVVDELLARRAWPDRGAIGEEIRVSVWRPGEGFVDTWAEVVGVVAHLRHHDPSREVRDEVFLPVYQLGRNQLAVALRTDSDPSALAAPVRREIAAVDRDLGMSDLRPLDAAVATATAGARFAAAVVGGFAVFALLLAALGIHGVVSYAVARRVPEIALRRALGATASDVVRLVAAQGAWTLLCGVAVGLAAAAATAGLLEGLLFGVGARDLGAGLVATATLIAAAAFAMLLPARRALAVDPLRALREDD
jgi:predicted permease